MVVQVNGKVRDRIEVDAGIDEEDDAEGWRWRRPRCRSTSPGARPAT